jgi:hypothetical protein
MSQDFAAFARACGLDLVQVKGHDRIYRCPTFNKPGKNNGAYMLRRDGNGWVIAYDAGGELQWFDDPAGPKKWTNEEKLAWERQRAKERLERERNWARSATQAEQMLKTCRIGPSGYLHRKGFPSAQSLCLPDGATFIPMRNLMTNELQGAQVIRWLPEERQWEKKFLWQMNPRLAVMRLGAPRDVATVLVEGYATGLSVLEACRQMYLTCAVVVCFSDANLVRVAEALQHAPFDRCVFADNDDIPPQERAKRDRGEPFEARGPGELAAVKTGLPYSMPPQVGMDANDWHMKHGVMSLCALVQKAIRGAR